MRTELHTGVTAPAASPGTTGSGVPVATLVDLCRARAAAAPDRRGYVFLGDGFEESDSLTLGELDRRARAIAVTLRDIAPVGARAMLSYRPGLDFHAAFLGCLYAGLVAVPVAPLDGTRHNVKWTKVEAVAVSSQPLLFLSTVDAIDAAGPALAETEALADLVWIPTDEVDPGAADGWTPPEIGPETVAYLQYSSGSTGLPKGVTITHANVLANLALIYDNTARESDAAGLPRPPAVGWLPLHHNMGLIGGVLDPLFAGRDMTLLPPAAFLQRPYAWLRAISALDRADSLAPNFALDLCVQRITDEQRGTLDLGGWEMALIGGEPVRAATLERFCRAFAPAGFRPQALLPGYGLAESTVMVTGGPLGSPPVIRKLDSGALAADLVRLATPGTTGRHLVGCGQVHPSTTVVVVDPATGRPRGDNEVGEVLVAGPSVGRRYWNAPEQTAETFGARLPDHPGKLFLRTGDLGFLLDGQLFVTGRAKEVVIVAGANHYPHDIEATVSVSHPAVRPFFAAAFAVEDGDRERLVVLAELSPEYRLVTAADRAPSPGPPARTVTAGEVTRAVRRAVNAEHGIGVHDVVLLPPGTLPFTTSGKLQRRECRTRYLNGTLT